MSGASIAAEVDAALREVGTEVGNGPYFVTIVRAPDEPTNPWDTGNYGEPEEIEYVCIEQKIDARLIDGTLIMAGDRMFSLTAKDKPEPLTSDKLIVDDILHSIIMVTPKRNAGVAYSYQVQARK